MEHHMYDKNICTRKTTFTDGCPDPSGNTSSRRPLGDGLAPLGKSALFLMLTAGMAAAEVITVDDDGKADFASIQAAIDYASDGDEVLVEPGVYTSDGENVVDFLGKAVTVQSTQGAEVTFIDGEGMRRGVICENDEGEASVLDGFTIRNGMASMAGGMWNRSSDPTVRHCTFENNSAELRGGGMYNQYSSPMLESCTFKSNEAEDGGGIFNYGNFSYLKNCAFISNSAGGVGGGMANYSDDAPTLDNCTFISNSADKYGAGMYNGNSSPDLTQCIFLNNSSAIWGGGMYNVSKSNPTLVDCTFQANHAPNIGGGLMNHSGSSPSLTNCSFIANTTNSTSDAAGGGMVNYINCSPNLLNCTFSQNASAFGGGLWNYQESSPTLVDCTFEDNAASRQGGGMYSDFKSNATLTACTFVDNSSEYGGAVRSDDSNVTLVGCTFTRNHVEQDLGYAPLGGAILHSDLPDHDTTITVTECTFFQNLTSGQVAFGGGLVVWGGSAIVTACVFESNSANAADGGISGGGALCTESASLVLTDSYFASNATSGAGGGLYTSIESDATVENCTFTGNYAAGIGGSGIYNYDGSNLELSNTLVCNNGPDPIYGEWIDNGGNTVRESCISDCFFDFNGDGVVDGYELTYVLGAWGTDDPTADIIEDGIVDGADLNIILASWGACP